MSELLNAKPESASWSLNEILKSQTTWFIASLVVLTGAVYWPVHSFDFVNWDDPWYVLKNEYIRSWHPQQPGGHRLAYRDNMEIMRELWRLLAVTWNAIEDVASVA